MGNSFQYKLLDAKQREIIILDDESKFFASWAMVSFVSLCFSQNMYTELIMRIKLVETAPIYLNLIYCHAQSLLWIFIF